MLPGGAKRILIYGVCGSGKSTFAKNLSDATGIPWTSVDDIAWLPGWIPMPDDAQAASFSAIVQGDAWIMDTAYGKWLDVVLDRTDLIVGLDYPRWFSLARLLRRTARRVVTKELCCNHNIERIQNAFSRDSIIVWHFRSFARKRQRIRSWAAAQTPPMIAFRRAADAQKFLESLSTSSISVPEPGQDELC